MLMKKSLLGLAVLAACAMAAAGENGSDTSGTGTGAPPPPAPAPAAPVKVTKARVLTDCDHGKANDVVSLSPDALKQAKAAGVVDDDKGAVKYAEGLAQNPPKAEG